MRSPASPRLGRCRRREAFVHCGDYQAQRAGWSLQSGDAFGVATTQTVVMFLAPRSTSAVDGVASSCRWRAIGSSTNTGCPIGRRAVMPDTGTVCCRPSRAMLDESEIGPAPSYEPDRPSEPARGTGTNSGGALEPPARARSDRRPMRVLNRCRRQRLVDQHLVNADKRLPELGIGGASITQRGQPDGRAGD